jgi:hypothetical protein
LQADTSFFKLSLLGIEELIKRIRLSIEGVYLPQITLCPGNLLALETAAGLLSGNPKNRDEPNG